MAENIDAERASLVEYLMLNFSIGEGEADFHARYILGRRTPSASIGEDRLPELPSDDELRRLWNEGNKAGTAAWSSADCDTTRHVWQMRKIYEAIARKAIAADRRARGSSPQAAQGVDTPEFRACEAAYVKALYAWEDNPSAETGKAIGDARAAMIAQLARQSQGGDDTAAEMKRLHDALCFWLPQNHAGLPDAMQQRIAADAYLLVGYDDMPDAKSAEELGWIVAAPPLSSEQQADAHPCSMPGCSGFGKASSIVPLCPGHRDEFIEWRKSKEAPCGS
jgi:hypothetical protein